MQKNKRDWKVCAIGFDRLGFEPDSKSMDTDWGRIDFLSKIEAESSQLSYDGYLIPSGVYERITETPDRDGPRSICDSDLEALGRMEAKVLKQMEAGSWVCLLVDEMVDKINEGTRYPTSLISTTDLAKRILNRFRVQRQQEKSGLSLSSHLKAFEAYVKNWASTKVSFLPSDAFEMIPSVSSSKGLHGLIIESQVFVLPCFRKRLKGRSLGQPCFELLKAIDEQLRAKKEGPESSASLPEWAQALQFRKETELKKQRDEMQAALQELEVVIDKLESWKGIVSFSGEPLFKVCRDLFQDFFGFWVDQVKSQPELSILRMSESSPPLLLIRVEAMDRDLKRNDLNVFDSQREEIGESPNLPGLLLLNPMDDSSFEEKLRLEFDSDKRQHAQALNLSLMRSLDLLLLMQEIEDKPQAERQKLLLESLLQLPVSLRKRREELLQGERR
ncbi:MAG: hypothetical protein EA369_03345 [Bradymonadales bacterium]|nr:MAG: hypothetical protein EA369_03345 [Bradymonadales bacterium]